MYFLNNFYSAAWWFFGYDNHKSPYSYHHIHNFTKDVASFQTKLKSTALLANNDVPEAGLDALMQTIACAGIYLYLIKYLFDTNLLRFKICFQNAQNIGISITLTGIVNQKRQNATKIVIYLSDADVHSAMDGLSAEMVTRGSSGITGIVTPAGKNRYI